MLSEAIPYLTQVFDCSSQAQLQITKPASFVFQ